MVVDPNINKTPDILKPFDYKMRVRRFKGDAIQWMDYNKTQAWSPQEYFKLLKDVRASRKLITNDLFNKLVKYAKENFDKITSKKA